MRARSYVLEVTSPFAQNCTLSGAGQEPGGNIPERPQAVGGLSRVPIVVARERDVLPAERRGMGERFVGDNDALGAEVLDGTVEIGRVPVDDGGRQQAQPRSPVRCAPTPVALATARCSNRRRRSSAGWCAAAATKELPELGGDDVAIRVAQGGRR